MSADPTEARLAELDPESRALLELSMLRGLSDEDLATMLGTEPQRVRERREAVLGALGADSEQGRARLVAELRGEQAPPQRRGDGPRAESVESPLGGDVPSAEVPGDEPSPARGPRRPVWAVVGGLTIAAVVALVLALGTNDDTEEGFTSPDESAQAEPEPEPGAAPLSGPPATLEALGGTEGRATAQIVVGAPAPKLRLVVSGLPVPDDGGYVVWLYNSVSDARELTGSRRGAFSVSPALPPASAQYRFLDISREPADGNRNHSGASVLRAAIEDVPRVSE